MERAETSCNAGVVSQSLLLFSSRYCCFLLFGRTGNACFHLFLRMAFGKRVSRTFGGVMRNAPFGVRTFLQLLQSHLQREHFVSTSVGGV